MKIRDLQVICTAPDGIRLVIVKIEVDSGEYGLGCATFTQWPLTVVSALENYLKPLIVGRDSEEISDAWQAMYLSGYWRNGGVLNNAIAGVDQALWDLKGKTANKPVYDLIGGKVRKHLETYVHVNGANSEEVVGKIETLQQNGFKNFRIQISLPGVAAYGSGTSFQSKYGIQTRQDYRLSLQQNPWNEGLYIASTLKALREIRKNLPGIGMIHDVHERVSPQNAISMSKEVEDLDLIFLEDPFAPEDLEYLRNLKTVSRTPIAMGELFSSAHEYVRVISERWVDFIRCHITQIGGFTPALKLSILAESFGVKTAWHGPGDLSPIGHAAHMHLGAIAPNFGIQEVYLHGKNSESVFKGIPEISDGNLLINNRPGFGIDIDFDAAAAFPFPDHPYNGAWPEIRREDGTIIRP
jgi:mannonate dehydratase